jgi:hypothetical protein
MSRLCDDVGVTPAVPQIADDFAAPRKSAASGQIRKSRLFIAKHELRRSAAKRMALGIGRANNYWMLESLEMFPEHIALLFSPTTKRRIDTNSTFSHCPLQKR